MGKGMFAGIEEASSQLGGDYIKDGKHRLLIGALKTPPPGFKGQCFIAEMTVVTSDREDYKPGKSVSYVVNMTKHGVMALGNIKAYIAAVSGLDEDDVTTDICDEAVGDDQPFAGWMVDCEAWTKKTKDGGDFTATKWAHVGQPDDDDVPF